MPCRGHSHERHLGLALKSHCLDSGRGRVRMQDESRNGTREGTLEAVSHGEARGLQRPGTAMDDPAGAMLIAVMSGFGPDTFFRGARLHVKRPGAPCDAKRAPDVAGIRVVDLDGAVRGC